MTNHTKLLALASASALVLSLASASLAQEYNQAPSLDAKVEAGTLPPVEERLPPNPMVIEPTTIGQYGGNLRTVLRGGSDFGWLMKTAFYDNLVRWNFDFTDVEPNVAESWEVNEDATVYTIKLREGLRWSDGVPFSSEDVAFWWELFSNDTVNPGKDSFFTVGGSLAQFEIIDDLTFRFTFAAPNGLFMQRFANPSVTPIVSMPKHAASKYHPDYNPEADNLAKALGYDSGLAYLQALFPEIRSRVLTAEFPVLSAWKLTSAYDANSTVLTAERNPYYFKVDPEGNQLPYIDTITYEIGTDVESLLLKAQSRGLDLLSRHINTIDNKSVLYDGQEQGDYTLFNLTSVFANTWAFAFNLTTPDDLKRELFNNKDFRIAMSHAIDRQEIIDTVYFGLTNPAQPAVAPGFPNYYNEQLAKQFTEFDTETANRLLDELGLDGRDADGYRLGPDGNQFLLTVETINTNKEWTDVLEMVAADWNAIGIRTKLDFLDRSLLQAHIDANEYESIVLWPEGGGGMEIKLMPRWFVGVNPHSGFGPGWYYNYLGDPRGDDWTPPENVQRSYDLYRSMLATADTAEQDEYVKQFLQQAADNFFAIGIAEPLDGYGIVSNRVHNLPLEGMFDSFEYPQPAPAKLETLWLNP
ncbi:MAG: hypothetical protein ABS76_08210 [Pelagibacterium sp. SCN 64-44]|nr:MAG: hypothetical protein ABS76_08210 [Pelagibacterium sp. SCN 64-44]